jgi:hypothetical protein
VKTIGSYSTPAEAYVAMTRIESAGIKAVVRDEFIVSFHWLISDAIGGRKD